MTRIIAGRLRGTTLRVPASGTRPTSDRVREALFSAVDARLDLDGVRVLDLFAGSGALGIEAASRGAETVWFVESSRQASGVLRRNVAPLAAHGIATEVRTGALPGALAGRCPLEGGFDLVLADPPYDRASDLDAPVLEAVTAGGWLAEGALVVWERSSRSEPTRWPEDLAVVFERAYGETFVEMAEFVDTVGP